MIDLFQINDLVMFYTKQYVGLKIETLYNARDCKFRVIIKSGKNEWSKSITCFTTYGAYKFLNDIVIEFLAKGCYCNG